MRKIFEKQRVCLFLVLLFVATANAGWKDELRKVVGGSDDQESTDGVSSLLDEDEVAGGLKQALEKGVAFAVDELGEVDGFWGNEAVRIPMPGELDMVDQALRKVGKGEYADEFVEAMNRAAEQAVPLTLDILKEGIANMTFDDAKSILGGSQSAATDYLRQVGGDRMSEEILPVVKEVTENSGATRTYKRMFDKMGFMASLIDIGDYDLDAYITSKAMDGLFFMIAEEERKIRENPLERSTELLKTVFGSLD